MTYADRDFACKVWLKESRPVIDRADKIAAGVVVAWAILFLLAIWLH